MILTKKLFGVCLLGAEVDLATRHGYTALHFACQNGFPSTVALLLQYRADTNVQTEEGYTALLLGCYGGHKDITTALLKADAGTMFVFYHQLGVVMDHLKISTVGS